MNTCLHGNRNYLQKRDDKEISDRSYRPLTQNLIVQLSKVTLVFETSETQNATPSALSVTLATSPTPPMAAQTASTMRSISRPVWSHPVLLDACVRAHEEPLPCPALFLTCDLSIAPSLQAYEDRNHPFWNFAKSLEGCSPSTVTCSTATDASCGACLAGFTANGQGRCAPSRTST